MGGQVDGGGPRATPFHAEDKATWTVAPFPDRAVSLLELSRKKLMKRKHGP